MRKNEKPARTKGARPIDKVSSIGLSMGVELRARVRKAAFDRNEAFSAWMCKAAEQRLERGV